MFDLEIEAAVVGGGVGERPKEILYLICIMPKIRYKGIQQKLSRFYHHGTRECLKFNLNLSHNRVILREFQLQ